MGSKVREINEKFKNFLLGIHGIGLIRLEDSMVQVDTVATSEVSTSRQTNSLPLQLVVGRVKEVSKIVDMLLSDSSEASTVVSALSIVGMGGLGKTTLVKSVYNNPKVENHFSQKIWICVSNKFEVTEIFRLILESLKVGKVEKCSQDGIVQKIRELIADKRFLLVLGDVWNEDQKLWDEFFTSLVGLNIASGSCCLVTTRLHTTANLVSTLTPFVLDKLSDDECWHILCSRATNNGEMPQQLDVYRERVLKRCQGLPLAANVVGGLLRLQKREEWLSIVEEKIIKISEYVEGEITPILRLSFEYLPSLSIKKCFAYCSIYSKNTKIHGHQLVELWMAEGFLQEDVERRITMEEIGENYLTTLLQSSLLEKVYDMHEDDSYQIHDLIHDLVESMSKREQVDVEVHHLALPSNDMEYNARSTLVRITNGNIFHKVIPKLKSLRLLNLYGIKQSILPNGVGKLKHLCYLDISFSVIDVLPESLCKLYNLQTLRLDECFELQCLPQWLSSLISLRHLHFYQEDYKMKMPLNMGQLTCLQTLNFFNVGEEIGREIKEIGSMKNLKGTVEVRNLELVKDKQGARLANLFEKQKLVGLELSWGPTDRHAISKCNDENVLEGLEPHRKLQELRLRNYMGARLPQWVGKLTLLTKLRFNNCKNCKDIPSLGNLPYLEDIEIEGSDHIICIGDSLYFEGLRGEKVFPSLKSMKLKNLPNLSEWKELEATNGHVFSKLESLNICDCCQLASVPTSLPSLQILEIEGNVRVSVVKDIIGKSASLLKRLVIRSMGGLISFSSVIHDNLTCLEMLLVYGCDI